MVAGVLTEARGGTVLRERLEPKKLLSSQPAHCRKALSDLHRADVARLDGVLEKRLAGYLGVIQKIPALPDQESAHPACPHFARIVEVIRLAGVDGVSVAFLKRLDLVSLGSENLIPRIIARIQEMGSIGRPIRSITSRSVAESTDVEAVRVDVRELWRMTLRHKVLDRHHSPALRAGSHDVRLMEQAESAGKAEFPTQARPVGSIVLGRERSMPPADWSMPGLSDLGQGLGHVLSKIL